MFIIAAVGAHEGREVAKFDIPWTHIHTETDEDVIMFLEVALYEIMVKVSPMTY